MGGSRGDTGGRLSPVEETKPALVTCTKIRVTGTEEAASARKCGGHPGIRDTTAGVSCGADEFLPPWVCLFPVLWGRVCTAFAVGLEQILSGK